MVRVHKALLAALWVFLLCGAANAEDTRQAKVDQSFEAVTQSVKDAGLASVLTIDHARMAAVLAPLNGVAQMPAPTNGVGKDFAIIELRSSY